MNNSIKYENMSDYSLKLSEALKPLNAGKLVVNYGVPTDISYSFDISSRILLSTFNSISEVESMLEKFRKLPTLDIIAIKDNKNALKAKKQIIQIRSLLKKQLDRLKKKFDKCRKNCYEQYSVISKSIDDRDDFRKFREDTFDFRFMMYENEKEIPYDRVNDLGYLDILQTKKEHVEEEATINNYYKLESDRVKEFEESLKTLFGVLAEYPKNDLHDQINDERIAIRKAVSPKVISITKDNLESLRHSEQLQLDLDDISEIFKTMSEFTNNDRYLQNINKMIAQLPQLLRAALEEEREKETRIKSGISVTKNQIGYSKEAIGSYVSTMMQGDKILPARYVEMKRRLKEMSELEREQTKGGFSK